MVVCLLTYGETKSQGFGNETFIPALKLKTLQIQLMSPTHQTINSTFKNH